MKTYHWREYMRRIDLGYVLVIVSSNLTPNDTSNVTSKVTSKITLKVTPKVNSVLYVIVSDGTDKDRRITWKKIDGLDVNLGVSLIEALDVTFCVTLV